MHTHTPDEIADLHPDLADLLADALADATGGYRTRDTLNIVGPDGGVSAFINRRFVDFRLRYAPARVYGFVVAVGSTRYFRVYI